MNKTELVAAMAEQAELSKKDSEKAPQGFYRCCYRRVKEGGEIQLVGFSTLKLLKELPEKEETH